MKSPKYRYVAVGVILFGVAGAVAALLLVPLGEKIGSPDEVWRGLWEKDESLQELFDVIVTCPRGMLDVLDEWIISEEKDEGSPLLLEFDPEVCERHSAYLNRASEAIAAAWEERRSWVAPIWLQTKCEPGEVGESSSDELLVTAWALLGRENSDLAWKLMTLFACSFTSCSAELDSSTVVIFGIWACGVLPEVWERTGYAPSAEELANLRERVCRARRLIALFHASRVQDYPELDWSVIWWVIQRHTDRCVVNGEARLSWRLSWVERCVLYLRGKRAEQTTAELALQVEIGRTASLLSGLGVSVP